MPAELNPKEWYTRPLPTDPTTSFANSTVLITGSNTGIGLAAAIKFARLNASLIILGVRSLPAGQAAAVKISTESNYPLSSIKVLHLDMADFSSVRKFAGELEDLVGERGLDVCVLNAGVSMGKYEVSKNGWELALQVNLLSTALLGLLMMRVLRKTAVAKKSVTYLEMVGSDDHKRVPSSWIPTSSSFPKSENSSSATILEQLNEPSFFGLGKNYAISKLLILYVMQGLVDLNKGKEGDISVVTICPGLCNSEMSRAWPWYVRVPLGLVNSKFARSTEEGSRTLVRGATLGMEANGKFWKDDSFDETSVLTTSEEGQELQARIWKEILDVLKGVAPEVQEILNT